MDLSLAAAPSAPQRRSRVQIGLRIGLISVIVVLGLGLRLRAALLLPTDYDEDDYLRAGQLYAQHLAAGDVRAIIDERENYEHPPMTKLAFGAVLVATQPSETYAQPVKALTGANNGPRTIALQARPLRIFSAVVGALTVAAVAIINPAAGLLVAINSWHIKYTSQAMLEALPCLFATLCLLTLRRTQRADGTLRIGATFWLAAVALGLAAAGKYLYGVGGVAVLIWIMLVDRRLWWRGVLWGALALVAFYAADPALWLDPVGRLGESLLFSTGYATGEQVRTTGFGWAQPIVWLISACPWHPGIIPILLDGVFAVFGLAMLRKQWQRERLITLWFVVNLAFLFVWPTKWPQYVLALTVAISFLAVPGLRDGSLWLRERWHHWRKRDQALRRQERQALRWLWPLGLFFALVVLYPLFLQSVLAVSQFQVQNLKGGISGLLMGSLRGFVGFVPSSKEAVTYVGTGSPVWLFSDTDFLRSMRFNVLWVVITLALATVLGLWLATRLERPGLRGKHVWRTVFILPWAIPEFVGALIWNTLLDDAFGGVNFLTGTKIDWLGDRTPLLNVTGLVKPVVTALNSIYLTPLGGSLQFAAETLSMSKAFWALVMVSVWLTFPFMLVIALAALRTIPRDVYDAARVDGAAGWTLWRTITWPLVRPSIWGGVLLRGALLFNAFHVPLMLISDPERTGTTSLAMIGYYVMRFESDYSFAAVINTIALGLAVAVIWFFNRQTRVVEGVEYV